MGQRRIPLAEQYNLSKAKADGMLVRLTCHSCGRRRCCDPTDLMQLFVPGTIEQMARRFTCQKCQHREFMSVEWFSPHADEWSSIVMSRIVRIEWRKRVVWRDDQ